MEGFLKGKRVIVDAGHGGTSDPTMSHYDSFRVGPTGLREEEINLSVSLALKSALEGLGCEVVMTRDSDIFVSIEERVQKIQEVVPDAVLSVHHNSIGAIDTRLNYPAVFVHGRVDCENKSQQLGTCLLAEFERVRQCRGCVLSDQLVFPEGFGLLREGGMVAPVVIGEFSFFNNTEEELRLRTEKAHQQEVQAYVNALEAFFRVEKAFRSESQKISIDWTALKVRWGQSVDEARHNNRDKVSADGAWFQYYQEGKGLLAQSQIDQALFQFEVSAGLFVHHYCLQEVFEHLALCYDRLGEKDLSQRVRALKTQGFMRGSSSI